MLLGKVKTILKRRWPLLVTVYHLGRRILRRAADHELWPLLLNELNRTRSTIFFVEVGAMDGSSYDPLYEYVVQHRWRGLLIEPLPDLFDQLRKTYEEQEGLIFENVAIAEASGTRTMYRVSREALKKGLVPAWANGIASLFNDRNALGGKFISMDDFERIRPHIVSETVICRTLDDIFRKHDIKDVDVLQTDVEGYDCEVLRQLDLDRFRPYVIRMEWCNLSEREKALTLELLRKHGYRTHAFSDDLVAWRKFGIVARA